MFQALHRFCRNPLPWGMAILVCLLLAVGSWSLQSILKLEPCVLCIYQRLALLGILLSATVGLCLKAHPLGRMTALCGWVYSAGQGLQFVWKQKQPQAANALGLLHSCPLETQFPKWLPLDRWFPSLCAATGSCTEPTARLLGLLVSDWLLCAFSGFFLCGVCFLTLEAIAAGLKRLKANAGE